MNMSLRSRLLRLERARSMAAEKPFDRAEALRLTVARFRQRTPDEILADRAELLASLSEPDKELGTREAALQRARRRVARFQLGLEADQ